MDTYISFPPPRTGAGCGGRMTPHHEPLSPKNIYVYIYSYETYLGAWHLCQATLTTTERRKKKEEIIIFVRPMANIQRASPSPGMQ